MFQFHIRPAKPDDVQVILDLIVDLATYEKEADSVKATPELLCRNLFETPYAHALVAYTGTADAPGDAVALALYFFNYSTWTGRPGMFLEDLYVKPDYRAHGIGKAIFAELGKIAQEKDCARLDWAVLKVSVRINERHMKANVIFTPMQPVAIICRTQWNTPSIDFYERSLGAKPMSEWMGMRLEEQGIDNLKKFAHKQ